MKEATGELNLAVIVAISIGILAAFFFGVLWPMIDNNFQRTAQCNKAVCNCSKEVRESAENQTGLANRCKCASTKDDLSSGDESKIFYCPFKG